MRGDQILRDRLAFNLDAQIPILQAEQKRIRKTLLNLTYPVLNLPPELTSEISFHCLPARTPQLQVTSRNKLPRLLRSQAPLLLLQICRQWREVAFATPKLWSSLQFTDCSAILRSEPGRQMAANWVSRSDSASLSMRLLQNPDNVGLEPPKPLPDVFLQIFDRAPQWQDVDLCFRYQNFVIREFHSALFDRLPRLESIGFHLAEGDKESSRISIPITAAENAPNLRAVSLTRLPLSHISLPWAQLKQFSAVDFSLGDCLQVLWMCFP
ncbi:hypothetical protein B0H10DRAFT_1120072 [Mycena sp. CBHHK59/15]|nr:hypothetical protein B0H10DRAFT_1120072 [Mycena sp. CBHHK59/15]